MNIQLKGFLGVIALIILIYAMVPILLGILIIGLILIAGVFVFFFLEEYLGRIKRLIFNRKKLRKDK